ENYFYRSPRQLLGDVYRIRNNRNIPKVTQRAADGRRSRAGIKDHDLTLFDQSGGASCDAQLLLAPKPFFFEQCWVFERSFPSWKRAAMCTVDQPVTVQNFQILANGNLRCLKFVRHVCDQHTAIPAEDLHNRATSFFVKHAVPQKAVQFSEARDYDCAFFLYRLLSFVQCQGEQSQMAPSLVLRKWRRTRTPAWRWRPAASHKKGQLAHSDTGILRHVLFSITKRRINILTAAN